MAKREVTNAGEVLPVLLMPLGRGRVGKTVIGNTVAQFFKKAGAMLQVWDMDQQTTSHGLAVFHPEAAVPPHAGLTDLARWLEGKIHEQALAKRAGRPFDSLLGVGGGDLLVKRLAQEVRLVRLLERMGIRPVALHVVGPDAADLDYLSQMAADDLFMPEATLIVLNAGLVADGRSAQGAFSAVVEHPALTDAVRRGAKIVQFPALAPMRQIAEGRLWFADAADGKDPKVSEPLSFFDQERTSIWWQEAVPQFFGAINPLWLPAVPQPAETAA